jgi:ligand-binding SRPBCC domain-containing protein
MATTLNNTNAPANAHTYEKRTVINTTLDKMMAFHEAPDAFSQLVPPPIIVQVIRDDRTSLQEGEIEFNMWFGPIPVRWVAVHENLPEGTGFADRLLKGPMQYWHHRHIFEETPQGVALIDRVTIAHKPGIKGILTRLMFDGIPLRFLFFYRHLRTKMATQNK